MSCKRCGRCCIEVGRTFWKNGNYDYYPEIRERSHDGDHEDGGLPCEMFEIRGKIGVCLIHERYGYEAKPRVCREYPDVELCFREEALATSEVT